MMIPRLALTTLLLTLCAFTAGAEEAVTVVRVVDLERLVPHKEWWENDLLTIVGAMVTAIFSVYLGAKMERRRNFDREERELQGIMKILGIELAALAGAVEGTIKLSRNNGELYIQEVATPEISFALTSTTGFRSTASKIGALDSFTLGKIVTAYNQVEGVRELRKPYATGPATVMLYFNLLVAMEAVSPPGTITRDQTNCLQKWVRSDVTNRPSNSQEIQEWLKTSAH